MQAMVEHLDPNDTIREKSDVETCYKFDPDLARCGCESRQDGFLLPCLGQRRAARFPG